MWGSIWDPVLLGFSSQLASQNPPKSFKNRCQEALHHGLQILIDFSSDFGTPGTPKIIEIPIMFVSFFDSQRFKYKIDLGCHIGTNLVRFASKDHPTSSQKRTSRGYNFFIQVFHLFRHRFWNDLGSNLVPSWLPSWAYVWRQNRIKIGLDGCKVALNASKTRLGARIHPDPLQASIVIDF